jgi:hypothetical protein
MRKVFIRDALPLVLDAAVRRLTLPFSRVRQVPASADVASENLAHSSKSYKENRMFP